MIRLNNVNKYYFKGKTNEIHVINDVTLELPSTGMVAFFGKSGCGKTTLLNAIGGLDKIASGQIEVDGKNIRENTDQVRNRYMGYIFQNYYLNLQVNIYENVAESLRLCGVEDEAEIDRRVRMVLKKVGLEKNIFRMPDTLSGGQKQRVAIARAIVKSPSVILADEPTGNLDEKNTIMIMDLLKSISKEHLVLLVTHEANLVDYYCDQVVELLDGRIVNVRENANANGYVAREKNVVYLGELEKRDAKAGNVTLNYYGEAALDELHISLVNKDGMLLLQVDTPNVKFLDENSEIVLKEGCFQAQEPTKSEDEDASFSLEPIAGRHYGRLFSFRKSARESIANMKRRGKKSGRGLRYLMMVFAMLLTVMVAYYASGIDDMFQAKKANNQNAFYVYADTEENVKRMYSALYENEFGIDYIRITDGAKYDENILVDPEYFESFVFDHNMYGSSFSVYGAAIASHGVFLPHDLCKKYPLLYGRNTDLKEDEAVISRRTAEIFLERTKYRFVKKLSDLLDMHIKIYDVKIVGIVDYEEPEVYVDRELLNSDLYGNVEMIAENGIEITTMHTYPLEKGEIIYTFDAGIKPRHRVGETIEIKGKEFVIVDTEVTEGHTFLEYLQLFYQVEGTIIGIYSEPFTDQYVIKIEDKSKDVINTVYMSTREYENLTTYREESYCISDKDANDIADYFIQDMSKVHMMIHSTDAKAAEKFLNNYFRGLPTPSDVQYNIITPNDMYEQKMQKIRGTMKGGAIICGITILLLSGCMYMLMRSGLMNRVKEIGVYRCIGVTKRNLIFRFGVETFTMINRSVLPGYLLVVGFICYMSYFSAFSVNIFLPYWICLPLLALLYLVCMICGILPVCLLLRKTPSEIMAKYDV